jgi:hypothetical protein
MGQIHGLWKKPPGEQRNQDTEQGAEHDVAHGN